MKETYCGVHASQSQEVGDLCLSLWERINEQVWNNKIVNLLPPFAAWRWLVDWCGLHMCGYWQIGRLWGGNERDVSELNISQKGTIEILTFRISIRCLVPRRDVLFAHWKVKQDACKAVNQPIARNILDLALPYFPQKISLDPTSILHHQSLQRPRSTRSYSPRGQKVNHILMRGFLISCRAPLGVKEIMTDNTRNIRT